MSRWAQWTLPLAWHPQASKPPGWRLVTDVPQLPKGSSLVRDTRAGQWHEGAIPSRDPVQWYIPKPLCSLTKCLLAHFPQLLIRTALQLWSLSCFLLLKQYCYCCGFATMYCQQVEKPPLMISSARDKSHQAFQIKAKHDSPNFRPPRYCLHKSKAYLCTKSSSFQSYSNARNKSLLWLHIMLKDRWRRAQCLCWIQMSAEIIPVIANWCCICL